MNFNENIRNDRKKRKQSKGYIYKINGKIKGLNLQKILISQLINDLRIPNW